MITFLCRTPIQVFRLIQLKEVLYKDETVDVFVFSSFQGAEPIAERLKKSNMFSNVYFIKDSEFKVEGAFKDLKILKKDTEYSKILKNKMYTDLFTFNIFGPANEVAFNILKKNNPQMLYHVIEGGPAIYHIDDTASKSSKYIYPFIGFKASTRNIDYWWFSRANLMEPFGKGKKRNLPVFDRKNKNLINTINYIFNYKDIPELKNADVILMEEFYKNDGFFDSDVDKELFKKLLQFHPNLNVVMKLHPRSVENRFSNDFFVMENNGIPWEVYSMNCDLQDKILISLSCSTMASTKLLFGDEIRSLLLYPILLDEILKKEKGKSYFNKNFRKKLNDRRNLFDDKSKYYVANSFNDANDKLTQWTGELNN